ncbi:MFS family permease [Litorivivens lipolytica]|uniref:MFS family permease n=1 Tax=Litorivivens lipolytica TaxID=1524264 RepID=A0A7W4Z5X7_9GAMM|nr:MFS transporter [Litorivivens lipolytica]MBB3047959.1 MFS family permease [Litorivivens lipolytica]
MLPTRFLGITLTDGIKRRHLVAYLLAALISSGYAGALAVLQPGLLAVMNIPIADQGSLTGLLAALQEVVLIAMMPLFGVMADRSGRKSVYAIGLGLTALGFFLYPYANSVSELIAYRLIVAFGGAAMIGMMVTVIADYASEADRGKANGLQGFIATIGAFIPPILGFMPGVFAKQGMTELAAQQMTFAIGGAMGVVGTVVVLIGLAPHVKRPSTEHEPVMQMLKNGLAAAKDHGVALSYGAAFISRGDLAVTGAFMGLWLVQFGTQNLGMAPSQAMQELAVPRVLTTVSGAMVGAILMGFISDRIRRGTAVMLASGLAAAVYLSVSFIDDPTAPWVFALLGVMGVAEISAFVSSQALVGQQAPAARRGAVIGFFGTAGAIGIMVGTAGGGWMFGAISPAAPFVLFGFLNAVVFIWAILVNNKIRKPDPVEDTTSCATA